VPFREFSVSRSHSRSIIRDPSVSPARGQDVNKDELGLLNVPSGPASQSADPDASLPVIDDEQIKQFFEDPRMCELYYLFIQEEVAKLIAEEKERLLRSPLSPSPVAPTSPPGLQDSNDQKIPNLALPPAMQRVQSVGDPSSMPSAPPPLDRSLSEPKKISPTTSRRGSTVATVHFNLDSPQGTASGGGIFGTHSHGPDQKPASNSPKEPDKTANDPQAAVAGKKPGIT
jgi:hypothetical protein